MPELDARFTDETGIDVVTEDLPSGDGLALKLTHYTSGGSEAADRMVLLLHGASAASYSFRVGGSRSLIAFLLDRGADVWTIDWRGSNLVSPKQPKPPQRFTLDLAAALDVPAAVAALRDRRLGVPLGVLGHCMGAGALAMAIGGGSLQEVEVDHVVLSTLGLFYQLPWDGWVKAEDHTLERVRGFEPDVRAIDADAARGPWPEVVEKAYQRWPGTFLPPPGNEIFRRLAFMYGRPYRSDYVPDDVHTEEELRVQFGEIPLLMYIHCAQNVRRGFVAPFDATDWRPAGDANYPWPDETYLNREHFAGIELTLITGSRNELWHPDSIHRMADWLERSPGRAACTRRIFPGYAHQDLLWGEDAYDEVYPTLATGLGL
jgi:cholesterol oxidase